MPAVVVPAVIAALVPSITMSALTSGVFIFGMSNIIAGVGSLVMSGASMLLSSGSKKSKSLPAARQTVTQNVRQPITPHGILYGQRRVGGPMVFMASTQDNLYLHIVVVLASHEVNSIDEVWFNDECIPPDYLDADGNVIAGRYKDFARIRKYNGSPSQAADSFLVSEVAGWTANHRLRGRAYMYIRLKFSSDLYTSLPNMTALVRGKSIYDPRDGANKFSTNAALIAADYLANQAYGFDAYDSIDWASVTTAANVCDEMVTTQTENITVASVSTTGDWLELNQDTLTLSVGDRVQVSTSGTLPSGISAATNYFVIPYQFGKLTDSAPKKARIRLATSLANAQNGVFIDITAAGSGTHTVSKNAEPRYHASAFVDTSNNLGDNMIELLTGFSGKALFVGGRWKLKAPVYASATVTLTETDIIAPLSIQTKISRSERFNQIKGVYISHLNKWQASDYPPVKNQGAIDDDGQIISRDFDLPCTFRPFTAQRIGKIELSKAVQEITVKAVCNLKALQVECGDNVYLTNTRMGWTAKEFEVVNFKFTLGGTGETPELAVELTLRETASDIYDWTSAEQAILDTAPNTSLPNPFRVSTPTGLRFDSIPVATRDGDEAYNIKITWDVHPDAFVRSGGLFEVQYKPAAEIDYQPSFFVDGELITSTIALGSSGVEYDIRIRAINNIGTRSNWQSLDGVITGSSGGVGATNDWALVTDAVSTSLDWAAVTDTVSTSNDWGSVT